MWLISGLGIYKKLKLREYIGKSQTVIHEILHVPHPPLRNNTIILKFETNQNVGSRCRQLGLREST